MERDHAYFGAASESLIHIDDLLDFSHVDVFDPDANSSASSSPATTTTHASAASAFAVQPPPDQYHSSPPPAFWAGGGGHALVDPLASSFSDDLSFPSEDVAELEWLSKFVEDSFSDSSAYSSAAIVGGAGGFAPRTTETAVPGRARSKRSRAAAAVPGGSWAPFPPAVEAAGKPRLPSSVPAASSSSSSSGAGEAVTAARRCTHCSTEKTPQWRTGPMGPKSLCNACGVRYKSGRLVPEYRPAASPSFMLTQHSNSHRKVMELRRQKELLRQEKFFQDFKAVC